MAFAITPSATAKPQIAAVLHQEVLGAAIAMSASCSAIGGGGGVGSTPGSNVDRLSPEVSPDESTADGDISVAVISGKSHMGQPV